MNPYFEQTVLNADPVELVRMILQYAVSRVRAARHHLAADEKMARAAAISRAYLALSELVSSLRADAAPEIAERLRSLYFYMQGRLLEANLQQADEPLAEVLGLLVTLAEGWTEAKPAAQELDETVSSEMMSRWSTAELTNEARLAITA